MSKVPHEITLMAIARDAETGALCVFDIVETSNHHAYRFVKRWMRDAEVVAIDTARPREVGVQSGWHRRVIQR